MREYTAREEEFEKVKRVGGFFGVEDLGRVADTTTESLHEWVDARHRHRRPEGRQPGCQPAAGRGEQVFHGLLGSKGVAAPPTLEFGRGSKEAEAPGVTEIVAISCSMRHERRI